MQKKLVMLVAMVASFNALAVMPNGGPYKETVGSIEWTFMINGGCSIVGGDSPGSLAIPASTSGAISIPATLGETPVVGIGTGAFANCAALTSVEIPESVTNVGGWAFHSCSGLKTAILPSRIVDVPLQLFANCYYLTKVELPLGLKSIGDNAFQECNSLSAITIPEGVTNIGKSAFWNCTELSAITIPRGVSVLHNGISYGCKKLSSVVLPSHLKCIEDSAFYECWCLSEIKLPDFLLNIGNSAFSECPLLKTVVLPLCVTNATQAFYGYGNSDTRTRVETITIPPSVKSMYWVFGEYNRSVKTIIIDNSDDSGRIKQMIGITSGHNNWSDVEFVKDSLLKTDGGPYTQVVDDIEWTYMVTNGMASVGTGSQTAIAIPYSTSGDVEIPESLGGCQVRSISVAAFKFCSKILSVTIPSGVTNIGNFAFSFCDKLQSVSIPASVTDIGSSAFAYSGELLTLTVDENNLSYSLRNGLLCSKDGTSVVVGVGGDVIVPDGATSIDRSAFTGRSSLRTISLPSSLKSVWYDVFNGCSGLTSICIDGNNQTYKSVNGLLLTKNGETLVRGVNGDVDIPSGVTTIGMDAFCGCKNLTSVKIPAGVTTIKSHAFESCRELTSITIPSSVTELGTYVFLACNALESIDFEGAPPTGLASAKISQDAVIRYSADYEDAWLPVIAACGFTNASSYTPPKPDGGPYVETIDGIEWTFVVTNSESSVKSADDVSGAVTIPSTLGGRPVTSIEDFAFYECSNLKSAVIPNGIARIGGSAFSCCVGMTNVVIPASVKVIGRLAFRECGLRNVRIHSGVEEIGISAFNGCRQLTDVYFEGNDANAFKFNTNPNLMSSPFSDCNWDLIIHVPSTWKGRGNTLCGYTVWRGDGSDVEKCVNMTVTNVVVQYVLNSIRPEIAVPVSNSVGLVNIITEVASSGAVSVPTEWKDNYQQFETKFGTDFGKALAMKTGKKDGAGNDMFVWQDFVAGTDPTDENDRFTASITIVDGVPVISYTPELTADQAALRVYKTYGKMKLTDTSWTDITAKTSEERANYNFFKVTVEMK